MQKNHVVYKIPCANCDATYVGQTKQKLITRLKKHKNNINNNINVFSVVTEHRLDTRYNIDWDKTLIIDTKKFFNKRLISERLHIKRQTNSLNKKTDTELFPDIYLPTLLKFPN